MFKPKTLFVVGAGASQEANLPVGGQLKHQIANLVDFRLEAFNQISDSGDGEIRNALLHHLRLTSTQGERNSYIDAARDIHEAMPLAKSIDAFIDDHNTCKKIELLGKLAIVKTILTAERGSLLVVNDDLADPTLNHRILEQTWFHEFGQILKDGYRKGKQDQIFENISFIVFNYDRCIEHYLYHFLKTYYRIKSDEAAKIMETLEILHPYGMVGQLPWQDVRGRGREFGYESNHEDLLLLAKQIRTLKEHSENQAAQDRMGQLVQDAKTIVFLGFGFHKPNLRLLTPPPATVIRVPAETQSILGTAKGLSHDNCKEAEGRIQEAFKSSRKALKIDLQRRLKCNELIRNFSLRLSH